MKWWLNTVNGWNDRMTLIQFFSMLLHVVHLVELSKTPFLSTEYLEATLKRCGCITSRWSTGF